MQADVCVRSVGGCRLFAEDTETREGEERKKDGENEGEGWIKMKPVSL